MKLKANGILAKHRSCLADSAGNPAQNKAERFQTPDVSKVNP